MFTHCSGSNPQNSFGVQTDGTAAVKMSAHFSPSHPCTKRLTSFWEAPWEMHKIHEFWHEQLPSITFSTAMIAELRLSPYITAGLYSTRLINKIHEYDPRQVKSWWESNNSYSIRFLFYGPLVWFYKYFLYVRKPGKSTFTRSWSAFILSFIYLLLATVKEDLAGFKERSQQ